MKFIAVPPASKSRVVGYDIEQDLTFVPYLPWTDSWWNFTCIVLKVLVHAFQDKHLTSQDGL